MISSSNLDTIRKVGYGKRKPTLHCTINRNRKNKLGPFVHLDMWQKKNPVTNEKNMSISAVKGENVSKLVLPNILQLYTSHKLAGKTYHIAFSFRPMSMILQCAGAFSCKVLGARRRDLVYQTLGEVANIGAHVCKYIIRHPIFWGRQIYWLI